MYKPNPIDTSKIELPEELLELTEKIAENIHGIGQPVVFLMDGLMVRHEMMGRRQLRAWFCIRN